MHFKRDRCLQKLIAKMHNLSNNVFLLILKCDFYSDITIRLNLFIVIYDRNIECFGIEKIFYFCINSFCCFFDILFRFIGGKLFNLEICSFGDVCITKVNAYGIGIAVCREIVYGHNILTYNYGHSIEIRV